MTSLNCQVEGYLSVKLSSEYVSNVGSTAWFNIFSIFYLSIILLLTEPNSLRYWRRFLSYTANSVMRYERWTTKTFKRSWIMNCGTKRLQHSGIQNSASACRAGNGPSQEAARAKTFGMYRIHITLSDTWRSATNSKRISWIIRHL